MDLPELCFHLRNRRRIYLFDDRYGSAVGFVEGYNSAFGGVPLSGFQDYVATWVGRSSSAVHWSYLIASTSIPEFLDGTFDPNKVPAELGVLLTDKLIDLLEAFHADGASER
ncbi:hypothetical protein AB0M48_42045 [Lentzea sp. NPDC051208]|uniref:hypothetical protein n=1 Tax=Lentzea sp. NPDC051208 TaxID=3154642 RepID=UPI0034236683